MLKFFALSAWRMMLSISIALSLAVEGAKDGFRWFSLLFDDCL